MASEPAPPPPTTAFGAILGHITGGHLSQDESGKRSFQPMNVNFGLFPPAAPAIAGKRLSHAEKGLARKRAITSRALADLETWLAGAVVEAAE